MHTTSHHQLSIKKIIEILQFKENKTKQTNKQNRLSKHNMDVRKYFVWKCIIFSYYLWHIYSNIFCKEHTYMQFHVNMIYKFVNFVISTRYLLRTMSAELLHLYKENRKWISAILAAPIPFGENYSVLGKVLFLKDHSIAEVLSLYWIVL